MSILTTDGTDYAEQQLLDNWAAEYAKRTISEHRSAAVLDHPDGSVTTAKLADDAVTSDKLSASAVTADSIASGAVGTAQLADYSVTTQKIAQGAVNNNRLANSCVDARTIAVGAVGTAAIAESGVENRNMADNSVGAAELINGAVGALQLATGAVITSKIADDAVTADKIADGSVTGDKIANNTIKAANMEANAVKAAAIEQNAVTTEKLIDGAVTAAKVSDEIITVSDVATTTEPGIVKLYNVNGTNRSGLIVQSDGGLLVNSNADYGTQRTGDGKLTTAGATETEIDAGTNQYKPITPATVQYAVEKYAAPAGLCSYSAAPQRIGTWIDGTPVWRVVFDMTDLTEDHIDIKIADSDENIRIVDRVAYTTRYNDNIIDTLRVSEVVGEGGAGWTVALTAQGTLRIDDILLNETDRIYGYIEFVTPESNLNN